MRILHRGTPEVNSGPITVRTHDAAEPSPFTGYDPSGPEMVPTRPDPAGARPIGYRFDAVPRSIRRDARLRPIDHQVVALLVSLATWRRDSCWTTVGFLAAQVAALRRGRHGRATVCERTIQRSLGRLIAAGHLRRDRVAQPDPDDPRNTTGYRYVFLWHPNQNPRVPAVAEAVPPVVAGPRVAAAPPSPQAGGGVTKESGNSLVTQTRKKIQEKELKPLNVDNAVVGPGPGKGIPRPTSLMAAPPSPPIVPLAPIILPTPIDLPNSPVVVEPPPAASPTARFAREREARTLVREIRNRGVHLWPEGEAIQSRPNFAGIAPLSGEEVEALDRLRGEVLALLREMKLGPPRVGPAPGPAPVPSGSPPSPAGGRRPAPRVGAAARAEVRRRIGCLASPTVRPADKAEAQSRPEAVGFAQELALALGDRNPVSLATATGLAADVLRGDLAEDCLHAAFDEACGRGKWNRGASFIASVRRWIFENRRGQGSDRGHGSSQSARSSCGLDPRGIPIQPAGPDGGPRPN